MNNHRCYHNKKAVAGVKKKKEKEKANGAFLFSMCLSKVKLLFQRRLQVFLSSYLLLASPTKKKKKKERE